MTYPQPEAPAIPDEGFEPGEIYEDAAGRRYFRTGHADLPWLLIGRDGLIINRVEGVPARPLRKMVPESTERPAAAPVAGDPDNTVLCPRCLHDGVLEQALDRAVAAEGKLAEVRAALLEGGQDAGTARRRAIAIITGSEEEEGNG